MPQRGLCTVLEEEEEELSCGGLMKYKTTIYPRAKNPH